MAGIRKGKRELFVKYIVADGMDQKDAYALAYGRGKCSEKTLIEKASKLAKALKPQIDELRQANSEHLKYDAEAHMAELNSIIESCKRQAMPLLNSDVVNYGSLTPVVLRAVELKGRMCGHYTDHHEITGKDGKPLEIKQIVLATGARS
jgi:hypothetical protein